MFKIYYCNLSEILIMFFMCIYVCAIRKQLGDQNVWIKLALFLVMYIATLWLFIKIKADIEMASLAFRQIITSHPIQFVSYIYVCYELSHTVWIVQF